MSAFEIIKEFDFKRRMPARFFAWLIFFCVSFGALPLYGRPSTKFPDLVFCPIQNIWVQKYVPTVVVKAPLDEICASSGEKSRFFFEMSKRMPLLRLVHDSEQVEKIFFNYLEKGKRAVAELTPLENVPESRLARLSAAQKSAGGGSYKTNFDEIQTEIFTLAQAARPPTAEKSGSFATANFSRLEIITRRLQPRAPPARS